VSSFSEFTHHSSYAALKTTFSDFAAVMRIADLMSAILQALILVLINRYESILQRSQMPKFISLFLLTYFLLMGRRALMCVGCFGGCFVVFVFGFFFLLE